MLVYLQCIAVNACACHTNSILHCYLGKPVQSTAPTEVDVFLQSRICSRLVYPCQHRSINTLVPIDIL